MSKMNGYTERDILSKMSRYVERVAVSRASI